MNSGVSLGSLLLGVAIGIPTGVVFAVTRRWFADLKATKAAVPKLRQSAWSSMWSLLKVGTGAVAVVVFVGWWAIRDASDGGATPLFPKPSASVSGSPAARR